MAISKGFRQLQPSYVLGTGQWVNDVAEQLVGSEFDLPNQLREHLPFFELARSHSVIVPRVKELGTATFTDNAATETDASTSILEDPADQIELTALEGTVEITQFSSDIQSFDIDQIDLHIELKKIAIRIAFWTQFYSTMLPNGFRGLPDLVAPEQTLTSDHLALADLDLLVARVTEGNGEMDTKVLVMNRASFSAFLSLTRATGAPLVFATLNGRRYATHNGVPILISDYIPVDDLTDIWCMTLGLEENGIFGIVPDGIGEGGLVVEEVQGLRSTDAEVYRVRWYCSIVLTQPRGLAKLAVNSAASGLM